MNIMKVRLFKAAAAAASVILISGCGMNMKDSAEDNTIEEKPAIDNSATQDTTKEDAVQMPADGETTDRTTDKMTAQEYKGPEKISFYMPDGAAGLRRRTTQFTGPWTAGKDILSLEVFAGAEEDISGDTFSEVWTEYWNKYGSADGYRLGYRLEFGLQSGERIERTILEPDDIYGFLEYIEVYIYDDVNVPPHTWYSHLLQEQVNADTRVTSIKLTCGQRIGEVSDISVSAFVYSDERDFDAEGRYTGNVQAVCQVYRE